MVDSISLTVQRAPGVWARDTDAEDFNYPMTTVDGCMYVCILLRVHTIAQVPTRPAWNRAGPLRIGPARGSKV